MRRRRRRRQRSSSESGPPPLQRRAEMAWLDRRICRVEPNRVAASLDTSLAASCCGQPGRLELCWRRWGGRPATVWMELGLGSVRVIETGTC